MLVVLAVICVVFFAYALTFRTIGDAVPKKVADAVSSEFSQTTPHDHDRA
jgi:hypothetical protein|nr:hypothetical protein [uncultured Rhodopila sp.]